MLTNKNEKRETLIGEIADFLVEEFSGKIQKPGALVRYYWRASNMAEKLLLEILGEDNYHFPIDIFALARGLDISIDEEDLNAFSRKDSLNKTIGQIVINTDSFSDITSNTIYIDKAVASSSRRYAVAHEIVHYILHHGKGEDYYEDYCIMPMCPKDAEEIVADIFAIFLLIPVRLFFEEFKNYVKERTEQNKTPVTTEDWMRYLAERSLLSDYYVAYGYQQLRYVAYWIYQAWYKDEVNKNIEMDEVERKEIMEATENYFDEELTECLFQ